eukprot:1160378-Pelagomonas_calceolata.AAC.10
MRDAGVQVLGLPGDVRKQANCQGWVQEVRACRRLRACEGMGSVCVDGCVVGVSVQAGQLPGLGAGVPGSQEANTPKRHHQLGVLQSPSYHNRGEDIMSLRNNNFLGLCRPPPPPALRARAGVQASMQASAHAQARACALERGGARSQRKSEEGNASSDEDSSESEEGGGSNEEDGSESDGGWGGSSNEESKEGRGSTEGENLE